MDLAEHNSLILVNYYLIYFTVKSEPFKNRRANGKGNEKVEE